MKGNDCDVIYQTAKTIFDHISKHRQQSGTHDVLLSIFDEYF